MTPYRIERGVETDAPRLQEIEVAAGGRFRDIGMADVAGGEPTPLEILRDRAGANQLYVARDGSGAIAGFLIWSPKDGLAYIEELSVHPHHAGNRFGARLIDELASDVRGRVPALSLATFREVPWNAPYYASLGFVEMPQGEAGSAHQESWRRQAENGLDMSHRLFMWRSI